MFVDIKGFEGQYQISVDGKTVKSLARSYRGARGRLFLLKEKEMGIGEFRGYLRVQLCKNGVRKLYTIHRIVAETFIPNPENKPQVNHINGIKSDNRPENLEWVTGSENIVHSYKIGLNKGNKGFIGPRGAKSAAYKRKWDAYMKPVLDTQTGKIYKSAREAASEIKMGYCHLSMCLRGVRENYTNLIYF